MAEKTILMVLTSQSVMEGSGRATGWWLEEMAAPYKIFRDAGFDVMVASLQGGAAPLDPVSASKEYQTPFSRWFEKNAEAQQAVTETVALANVKADDFDALFFPGGHGPLYDLAESDECARLIEEFYNVGKVVGAVCHGPAALRKARNMDGEPLVKGKRITAFSNSEEQAVGLEHVVPYLLESSLRKLGAVFQKGKDFTPYVEEDDNLLTGQNPMSSQLLAELFVKKLMGKI